MKINKIVLYHSDGSLHYVDGVDDILSIVRSLPIKLKWKHTANIETLHNQYFKMLTQMAKDTNTGYSKTDLHNAMKPLILKKFTDFPNYYTDRIVRYDTTNTLTYEGWTATIEQLKITANDVFGYTFK